MEAWTVCVCFQRETVPQALVKSVPFSIGEWIAGVRTCSERVRAGL